MDVEAVIQNGAQHHIADGIRRHAAFEEPACLGKAFPCGRLQRL